MARTNKLSPMEMKSVERIRWLVDSYCGGSQQVLAEKTGVSKASISQYLNYRNAPSNLTAGKLAEPWGINPAWLMGFDVKRKLYDDAEEDVDQFRQRMRDQYGVLFDMYDGASPEDRKKIEEMVKIITRHDDNIDGA